MSIYSSGRKPGSYMGWAAASAVLLAGVLGTLAAAGAETLAQRISPDYVPTVESIVSGGDPFAWSASPTSLARSGAALPAAFDLRDNDIYGDTVTPVKFQNPWGTCWAFGVVAASETSILSEASAKGIEVPEALTDLSERQLAWFTYHALPENDDADGQAGEGLISLLDDSDVLNSGGFALYGSSLFSSGIGPTTEQSVPYRGKQGIIQTIKDAEGNEIDYCHSADDDWSVDEEQRFEQALELEESVQLPSPGTYALNENWDAVDTANEAIKEQLYAGRAVCIGFSADNSQPGQISETGFMNPGDNETGTWAHYTYYDAGANHAVTIVGWDDTYSRENFGNPDPETGEVNEAHRPQRDGAWIVKNSWGSTGEFPNGTPDGWGTDGSGYFYLSYDDPTISDPQAFDFKVESIESTDEGYYNHQYDYMPSGDIQTVRSESEVRVANVFTADENGEMISTLGCETTAPGTEVTFEVYLLDDDAALPDDGELVRTVKRDFGWGGYHTVELEDDSLIVEGGQRFSVVITQQDQNGIYRASWEVGTGMAGREAMRQRYYDYYVGVHYRAIRDQYLYDKRDELIAQGLDEDTAWEQAMAWVDTDEVHDEIYGLAEKMAETTAERALPSYYANAVVNEGESFLFSEDEETGEASWADFALVSEAAEANGVEADNPCIKAYGYVLPDGYFDGAAAEQIAELTKLVATGTETLASAQVSVDGTDVPTSAHWVTADIRSALADALDEAATMLEKAQAGSVTQHEIEDMSQRLSDANEAFLEARKPGTKQEASKDPDPKPEESEKPAKQDKDDLPKTGDAALAGILATSLAGAGALIAGLKRRRK
ncbi:lectin like domain-containing protein [Collinsella phocaeensis]|uniref:lectin like domain-containing protein n=1 Tax=Collinsella phocaeensis TaxID=1871016 RepID=UPI0009316B7B|nr:lectin like domain-containing protein [Collinsella phocaeensis]